MQNYWYRGLHSSLSWQALHSGPLALNNKRLSVPLVCCMSRVRTTLKNLSTTQASTAVILECFSKRYPLFTWILHFILFDISRKVLCYHRQIFTANTNYGLLCCRSLIWGARFCWNRQPTVSSTCPPRRYASLRSTWCWRGTATPRPARGGTPCAATISPSRHTRAATGLSQRSDLL